MVDFRRPGHIYWTQHTNVIFIITSHLPQFSIKLMGPLRMLLIAVCGLHPTERICNGSRPIGWDELHPHDSKHEQQTIENEILWIKKATSPLICVRAHKHTHVRSNRYTCMHTCTHVCIHNTQIYTDTPTKIHIHKESPRVMIELFMWSGDDNKHWLDNIMARWDFQFPALAKPSGYRKHRHRLWHCYILYMITWIMKLLSLLKYLIYYLNYVITWITCLKWSHTLTADGVRPSINV